MFHPLSLIHFSAFNAWVDIRNLFVRTRLGTLWHAIGLIIVVAVIGTFFGAIFKGELTGYADYIPFLAVGLVVWTFLSAVVNESCLVFNTRAKMLRHISYPFSTIPLTITFKSLFIFVQNLTLSAIAYVIFFHSLPVLPVPLLFGVLLVAVNVYWLGLLTAVVCTRFRDLPQIITGAMYIGFFLSPIIWKEDFLGRYIYLNDLNPFYHLISLVRLPFLGIQTPSFMWIMGVAYAVIGGSITAAIYVRLNKKIPYWL